MENLCVLYFFDVVHCNFVLLEMATTERPLFQLYCSLWLKVLKCNTNIPKTKSILIQKYFLQCLTIFLLFIWYNKGALSAMKKKLRLNGIVLGQFFEMLTQIEEFKQKINCFKPRGQSFSHLAEVLAGCTLCFQGSFDGILGHYVHILAYFLLYAIGAQPNCCYGLNSILTKF